MAAKLKFNFTMSDADVSKGNASVKRRASSIRKDVHCLAVSILFNWAKSGDVSTAAVRATELLNSVDASHAQKVVNWFAVYAGFDIVDTDDGKVFGYNADRTKIDSDTFNKAKGETMFDLSPDKDAQAYDLLAKVKQLIETAERKRKKGVTDKDNIPVDTIEGLKALVN